jgi:hypothetical protein
MYFGEDAILQLVKKAFEDQKKFIRSIDEPMEVHMYLTRELYLETLEHNNLEKSQRNSFFGF